MKTTLVTGMTGASLIVFVSIILCFAKGSGIHESNIAPRRNVITLITVELIIE